MYIFTYTHIHPSHDWPWQPQVHLPLQGLWFGYSTHAKALGLAWGGAIIYLYIFSYIPGKPFGTIFSPMILEAIILADGNYENPWY